MTQSEMAGVVISFILQLELMVRFHVEEKCAAFFLLFVVAAEFAIFRLFQFLFS